MAGFKVQGKDEARKASMKCLDELKKKFAANLQTLILEVDEQIKSLTPVNTGSAVRNMIWTENAPNTVYYTAIDNGPPGPTNSMALGQEPRRSVNESAAAASLTSLSFGNPFKTYYLTNNDPDIEGLELGILPGPPLQSRSPNGMFYLTQKFMASKIASKGMLS